MSATNLRKGNPNISASEIDSREGEDVVNQNNTYLQLSAELSSEVKLIPRVGEFMTSNGIIRQNFHEYI